MELVPIHPVADELAARFAAAGHRLYLVGGSVRDALLGRDGRPTSTSPPTPARPRCSRCSSGWADAVWDTGIAFGTVGARRHGTHRRDHHVPRRRLRPRHPQPRRRLRRHHRGRPGPPRLHRQRDGRRADRRASARFVDPHGGLAALAAGTLDTPATPEESFADDPLRMLRAARFVSQLGLTPAPRVRRGDDGDGRRAGPDHPGAGAGRAHQADPRRGTRGAGSSCWSTPGWPSTCCPRCRRCGWRSTSTCSTRTSTRTRWWCSSRRSTARPTARTSCCGSPRCCTTSASPTTRRKEPDGRVSFHHHEVVGAKLIRRRLRELRYPKAVIDDVAQLVFLHLRFHGYGTRRVDRLGGAPLRHRRRARCWTGCTSWSAPTAPPATGAGPRPCSAATTRSSSGSPRCARRRSSTRSARTSTATRSCSCSGSRRARWSGKAYKHLLALRMERGPLSAERGRGRAAAVGGARTASASPGRDRADCTAEPRRWCRALELRCGSDVRCRPARRSDAVVGRAGRAGRARRRRPAATGATPSGGLSSAATATAST